MPGAPLHILLVDDNSRLLSLLKRTVDGSGYQVHTCASGPEALDWISQNPIDVLVTDLNMPEMSGQDLISRIRAEHPQIPILVLTGYPTPDLAQQLRELGADRVLTKPDDVKDLRRQITELAQAKGHPLPEIAYTQPIFKPRPRSGKSLPAVLILEDDPVWSQIVKQALIKNVTDVEILTCPSLQQAIRLTEVIKIDVLLCDIYLPDGYGIEFICDLLSVHPTVKVVVITATQQPFFRKRSEEIGVVRFLEKPVPPEEIIQLVRELLPKTPALTSSPAAPSPTAARFTPADMIQLKTLARATGMLRFYSPKLGAGCVYLKNGQIHHATCGNKSGNSAFAEILTWRDVEMMETPLPADFHPEMLPGEGETLLAKALE